jgi:hypothetical protein
MRLSTVLLLAGLVVGTLGCHPSQPVTQPIYPPPVPNVRQQMATLAFLSYVGGDLDRSSGRVEEILVPCMKEALAANALVSNWSLVWGPAVYKFSVALLDDNMMYVVRDNGNSAHLAIVVRGTNPKALDDWLAEDFDVDDQITWEYGNPPSGAKISKAISEGLLHLQTLTPAVEPGQGQTLTTFLQAQSKAYPSLQIDVTGHSLGGALAPTLALWLADTQADWAFGSVQFQVYPLAGPTAGNLEFATYYDSRLGAQTDRMHNPYDVVPRAWNIENLGSIADLYEPTIHADAVLRGVIDHLRDLVKDKDYTQIRPEEAPLRGGLNPAEKDFLKQAGWQHHYGYLCALGIDVATTSDCKKPPQFSPFECPMESRSGHS